MQAHCQAAVAFLLEELVGAPIPDLDGARAVLALGDLALEVRVLERMVLDVHGEVALARLERDALRHRPARERTVPLEPEVVVEPPRSVPLDDEDRLLLPLLAAGERLRCALRIAFVPVFLETHATIMPALTKHSQCRSFPCSGRISHGG